MTWLRSMDDARVIDPQAGGAEAALGEIVRAL
jgi:hypothetical protein